MAEAQYRLLLRYRWFLFSAIVISLSIYRTRNYTQYSVMPCKNLAKKLHPEEFASVILLVFNINVVHVWLKLNCCHLFLYFKI